jgi:hypothetical protein
MQRPLPYGNPACRAALTCTTNSNVVKAARRQSAFTWVFRMPHSKACVYKRPLTMRHLVGHLILFISLLVDRSCASLLS